MLREVDEVHGWELRQKEAEVSRVKERAKVKVQRLVVSKQSLKADVQDIRKSTQEAAKMATKKRKDSMAKVALKVKVVKNLAKGEMQKAKLQHDNEVSQLERQKAALRAQAGHQRSKFKAIVRGVEEKHEALTLLCSAAEVGNQKLARELHVERIKGVSLHDQTEALQREREVLNSDLSVKGGALKLAQEVADRAVVEQMRLAATAKEEMKKQTGEQKRLRKQKLAVDKKLQALKEELESMGKQLSKLNEELRTAKAVRLLP